MAFPALKSQPAAPVPGSLAWKLGCRGERRGLQSPSGLSQAALEGQREQLNEGVEVGLARLLRAGP